MSADTQNINAALPQGAFDWVGPDNEHMDVVARPSVGFWKDSFARLMRNKVAVFYMVIIAFVVIMAIVVPMVSPYTISEQHLAHTYKGMMFKDAVDGHTHLFGTDSLGRDLFTRVWSGARVSMLIAFAAVFINFIVGVIYGGIAGYFGGTVDTLMMRFIEILNGIPYLIIVILLLMILSPGIGTIIIAYAVTGWTGMARLVRGQIVSLKEQEFVVAVKAMGAKPTRIIARHLIPNILSVIIVNLTLSIPSAIFSEAFLSYIGLGVPIPNASWGSLANEGGKVFQQYPLQLVFPAVCISITMLAFNLLGDALRDAFDPKLRR